MRKKHKGATLGEEILEHLEKVKKKGYVKLIDESFYQEEQQNGIPFYVRRTDTLPQSRERNVGDEVAEEAERVRVF